MHPLTLVALVASLVHIAAPQTINPSSVDDATKGKWCNDQQSACPLVCLQIPGANDKPKQNTCDPNSLVYQCVCSNGQSPNASQYSQTIPYYECTTAGTQCVNACASGDTACQSNCRNAHPCGAQNPTHVNTSTIRSTMSTSSTKGSGTSTADSTATGTYSGFGGSSSSSAAKSDASDRAQALAIGFGRTYGLAMVLVGVCGGFMVLL